MRERSGAASLEEAFLKVLGERPEGARVLMRALLTVFRKEFLENLRDRRTLFSALLFGPLFGPMLFGAMVSRMLKQSVLESDEPLRDHHLRRRARARISCAFSTSQGVQLASQRLVGTGCARCGATRRRGPWC